jgi:hypothetical protein
MAKTESERQETKLIIDLKKQIVKLKRENLQLKKRNSRIENDFAEMCEDDEEITPPPPVLFPKAKCPKCFSKEVNIFELIGKNYFKCQSCSAQGQYKK